MTFTYNTAFSVLASLAMLLVVNDADAQSVCTNASACASSSQSLSSSTQSAVNYAPPHHAKTLDRPITNVYRPAAPMPQSNYSGYQSTNGFIPQPSSFVSHPNCNSTIALRVPRSDVAQTPILQTQSPSENNRYNLRPTASPQYVAPSNHGFSPAVSRPKCANGTCGL